MRIAVHGLIADAGYGSSAGAFVGLLRAVLNLGHSVDLYGIPGFTEPKALEGCKNYRFIGLSLPWYRPVRELLQPLASRYLETALDQVAHAACQRSALRGIEAAGLHYDFVLCLDVANLWRSRLPVVSWPQSPPQTEWAAFRHAAILRSVVRSSGVGYYAAIQVFYAYRWLQARAALGASDLVLCGSPWALQHWLAFGAGNTRACLLPYSIDIASFAGVPPPTLRDESVSYLWLGRATPRKRLDLFFAALERVWQRHPRDRARLAGKLDLDPAARALLSSLNDPRVEVSAELPHTEVPKLFAATHVLVQPSEQENFGFSVAEALAAGRPVVIGPTNGTAAFAGEAGFKFEAYEPDSLAEAMVRAREAVRANPIWLARAARRAAAKHFDPDAVARGLCRCAGQAIANARARQTAVEAETSRARCAC